MIKALEFRFGSASARSLIYLMSGIVVLLGGAALAFFYWQTSEFKKIETLANGYHLTTLDACASIKEELFLLEKASDQKSSTQGNGLVLPNQINSSAHIIEQRTDHILLLQDTFRQPEFQATVRSLETRTRQLLRLVAAEEATEGIAPALLQREVASLQVVTGQLQRLHASSYKESAAHLTTQEYANTRNLFIFVGVLLAVGFLVIWRIVVVTAAKGSEEKEYGPTVVLAIFLAGGIFLLDLLAPLGVAGAVPYVALVLVSLSLPHRKHTLAAATLASVLTVLGFFLSPAGGVLWVVLANRGLALFAIWVTATLGLLHKQAEQALRFTQVAVDHYSDLALWMTPDARFFYVNDAACRALGYSREELTSMKVPDINLDIPEETWPKIWSKIKQSGGFTLEARIRTKDGRIFPAEVKTNYVVFQGKEYNCSLVRDITERKRAEETLRLSEERFSKAFQSSPVNLVISTLKEGRILDVNDKFVRTSGYSREELIGHTARELNVWPRPSDRAQAIKQLQEKGSIRNKEVFLRTKSGELRLHSYSAETVIVAGHLCVLMVAEDITERKQAEQALRQSEASLAEAQRISHLGSWQWNPSDGSVLGSVELYRIFGFDPERTPSDYDTFMDRIHPKDRTALEQVLNDAVQEKKPFSIEYRISRPDGSVRIVLSQGEHMPAKKDQPNWMVGTVQDITERKQAEEALRKQAQIIDQIHDAVVSTDLDGYVTSWNKGAERLFGHTGEEMLGKPIAEVYPPEEHTFLQNQVIAPLKQNGEHEVEVRMRRKSGKDFFAHLSLSLLRDSNGTPTGMIGYSMDITERKRTEQALRQQAQVIDQIHDSVVSTDLDDYITSWNKGAEKLYGYRAEEVLGKHISLVYLDRDRQLSQKQLIDPLLELEEGGVGSPKAPKVRGTLRYPPLAFPAPRR